MSLTEGPVRDRLFALWLPMIGGILMVKAVGLADAYFVGQLGEEALAAISFTFPVVMTLISLAIGLGAGASSVLSRAIGNSAGRAEQQGIVTAAVFIAISISILLGAVGYFGIGYVLALMGASGNILADATAYMQIWFVGAVFLILPIAINGLLRSTGDGVSPALLMSGIAVLNIGLNPVFIYGLGPAPDLGMQGAAVATVSARAVSTVIALLLISHRQMLSVSLQRLRDGLTHWRELARVGLPASLSTSLNPIALSIATAAVATLGSAEVAAFGVATKLQSFFLVPLLALSSASPPLVAQNSSAGKIGRSRRTLLWCSGISLAWSVLIAVVIFATAEYWVGYFNDKAEIQEHVLTYLAIVPLSFVGYGITVSLSAAMNGLGRSLTALFIAGGRAMLLLAPAAWIGVMLGGFQGLAIATALTNLLAGTAGLLLIWRHSLTARDDGKPKGYDMSECE